MDYQVEQFTFFRSYYDAGMMIEDDADKYRFFKALFDYAFSGGVVEPDFSHDRILMIAWIGARANIRKSLSLRRVGNKNACKITGKNTAKNTSENAMQNADENASNITERNASTFLRIEKKGIEENRKEVNKKSVAKKESLPASNDFCEKKSEDQRAELQHHCFLQAAERIVTHCPRMGGYEDARKAIMDALVREIEERGMTLEDTEALMISAADAYRATAARFPAKKRGMVMTAKTFFSGGHYRSNPSEWELMTVDETADPRREASFAYVPKN